MSDDLTHSVTITVTGRYPHGDREHASVTMTGDGQIEHMLDTFRAALVAAGFSPAVADRLRLCDE